MSDSQTKLIHHGGIQLWPWVARTNKSPTSCQLPNNLRFCSEERSMHKLQTSGEMITVTCMQNFVVESKNVIIDEYAIL